MPASGPALRKAAIGGPVLLVVAVFAVLLQTLPRQSLQLRAIDDLSQAGAAFVGAGCCVWRAHWGRFDGHTRRWRASWWLLAAGTGSWAAGEMVWSYYELIARRQTPFPSIADAGFLMFPLLAMAAILLRPSRAIARRGRGRMVLDAVLVATSLFTVSWQTALGQVVRAGGDSAFTVAVGVAYPVTDLLVLSVLVMVLADAEVRNGLIVLSCGMAVLAIADSAFVYLNATGNYSTGSPMDTGWVFGFLLIGVAAMLDTGAGRSVGEERASASTWYLMLPYLLAGVGISITVFAFVRHAAGAPALLAAAVATATLFLRQLLMLLDNQRLIAALAGSRQELQHQAFHDPLTGLANSALFYDRANHALALQRRDLGSVSVLFADIDDFKTINDGLGHAAGDTVLVSIAERLSSAVRGGDTVARLGGDEFAILLEHNGDAEQVAQRLTESLSEPVTIAGRDIPVRASIGLAVLPATEMGVSCEELLARADLAMYAAKRAGKGMTVVYRPDLGGEQNETLDLSIALRADLRAGRVGVAFQPIFDPSGAVFGYEALARWRYAGNPIRPDVFIPIAEQAGLLWELDLAVIGTAMRAVAKLTAADTATTATTADGPVLSVNVGISNLSDPGLADTLCAMLDAAGLPPQRLMVEVLENRFIDDPVAVQTLRDLRDRHIRLALDDFGAGYSSLARMTALHPDVVKLDRSFVAPLDGPSPRTEILAGLIELLHRAGVFVLAEGIETPPQLALLTELGCDGFQGFLLGRPAESLPAPAQRQELPSH